MTETLILMAAAILVAAILVLPVLAQSVHDHRRVPQKRLSALTYSLSEMMRWATVSAGVAAANLGAFAGAFNAPSQAVIALADEEYEHAALRSVLSSPREAARLWKALRIAIMSGVDAEYLARVIVSLDPEMRRP